MIVGAKRGGGGEGGKCPPKLPNFFTANILHISLCPHDKRRH